MPRELTQDEISHLEELLDSVGTYNLLYAVVIICQEKASHIRQSYQDTALAQLWDRQAGHFSRFADKLCKIFPGSIT